MGNLVSVIGKKSLPKIDLMRLRHTGYKVIEIEKGLLWIEFVGK